MSINPYGKITKITAGKTLLKEIRRDLERLYREGQKAEGVGIHSNILAVDILSEIRRIVRKIKKIEGKLK